MTLRPSPMFAFLLVAIVAATAVTVAVAMYTRAPTHSSCPDCGQRTSVVMLPPLLRRNEFVHLRWCPACEWEGLGRNGPDWVPGKQLAHGSGFHWGGERMKPDFGFHFRRPEPGDGLPPHHPSGFHFANSEPQGQPPPHPSGFRFGDDTGFGAPPVFRWGQPQEPGSFQFKEPPPPEESGPGGFRWKGVA